MTTRAIVVTPVAVVEALAASCVLAGVAADVVPSDVGAIAVCHDAEGDAPRKAAATLSQLLKGGLIVVLQNAGGQITATGYLDGAETDIQDAGVWLDAAPVVVEDLITGEAEASDVEGAVSSRSMSRWRAARTLAKISRQARQRG